jgi:hypothetical protein
MRLGLEAAERRVADAQRGARTAGQITGAALAADVVTGGHGLFTLVTRSLLWGDAITKRDVAIADRNRRRRQLQRHHETVTGLALVGGLAALTGTAAAIDRARRKAPTTR